MSAIDRERWLKASHHLDRLLELPPEARTAGLDELRAEEPDTAEEVEALLAEHQALQAEGFLESPAAVPHVEPSAPKLTGVKVGAYTLLSPIGHGGMGSVWLAARSDGRFEGRVAVKLLNAALVGHSGEKRFKREGTILARLTHPNIARLIDAGVTSTGQPYLVLEYVEGQHIDRYCDERRLGIRERIRLFLDVQAAVVHAHAQLIVHRDLKPSNVLVTSSGQVKLLDFSIAKLIEDEGGPDAHTALTREGVFALTPKYAAPEQVTGGRITTATDVYALGVLLFELLTGRHPTAANAQTPAEFVKAVADTAPTRLSSVLAADAETELAASVALRRATTPQRLRRMLQGDLETIVSKALKRDPEHRYASVGEFADDLRRYLDDQPIWARPDSARYRLAKFAARHRRVVAAAALLLLVLTGLVGFHTARLAAERDRARLEARKASAVSQLLADLLTGADPYRTPDAKEPTVQNLLDSGADRVARDLRDQPDVQTELLTLIGRTYERMGRPDKALPLLERALDIGRRAFGTDPRVAQSLNALGVLQRDYGDLAAAERLLSESLAMRRALLGPDNMDVAVTLVELGRVYEDQGRDAEAEPLLREALAIRRRIFGDEHRETATSKSDLGRLLARRGELAEAEPLLRENLATTERLLGASHPNTAAAKGNLVGVLIAKGELGAAEQLEREAVSTFQATVGTSHPRYLSALNTLGIVLEIEGRLDQAQALFEQCVRGASAQLPENHPDVLKYTLNLARVRLARGEEAAAIEPALRRVLQESQRQHAAGDVRIAYAQSQLGAALFAGGRPAEAEPLMVAADRVLKPIPGLQERERAANRARLARLYDSTGRSLLAAAYR
jgi:serine/threonine protein kinase